MKALDLKKGDKITVNTDIITAGGQIIFKQDQELIVEKLIKSGGKHSNFYGTWIPEQIDWIKIKGVYGQWEPSIFKDIE